MPDEMKRVPKVPFRDFMVQNASLLRTELIKQLLDPRIDINQECGYPDEISAADYHLMYEREGLAKRVVRVFPQGCWAQPPMIYEQEKPAETEFEVEFTKLLEQRFLWHFLQRIDELSGIGRFGVLLLGLDDGQDLVLPAAGLDANGEPSGAPTGTRLLYLRAFDESVVTIASSEQDTKNPRFGLPLIYNVNYLDEATSNTISKPVHWTRLIHVADNRTMSEVVGQPRMQPVYNRLLDIRKILSGSGEMFWKGAFPGYSLETSPDLKDVELDTTSLREEMENYQMGLQRYLALTGVTARALSPQVSDPSSHVNANIDYIAITLGIPRRILEGSERGELASSQDALAWNTRLRGRQNEYLTPMLVRPFINRLVHLGVLPPTKETTEWGDPVYIVDWPDLNTVTDLEKADVAGRRTEALAKYVGGNIQTLVPPQNFFSLIMGMSDEESKALAAAAEEQALEVDDDTDEGDPSMTPAAQKIAEEEKAKNEEEKENLKQQVANLQGTLSEKVEAICSNLGEVQAQVEIVANKVQEAPPPPPPAQPINLLVNLGAKTTKTGRVEKMPDGSMRMVVEEVHTDAEAPNDSV